MNFLFQYLYIIFHTYLTIDSSFMHFRLFIEVVFQKSEKPNYTITKIYWSMTFLNIIEKIFKFIIVKQILYLTIFTAFYLQITFKSAF